MRPPQRDADGFAPIADYAVVGDRGSAALVALDGSIDWLCVPRFDSPSAFAALLDPHRGGRFSVTPRVPYAAERAYRPNSNVLETTYETASGRVLLTDALIIRGHGRGHWLELVRRIEGLAGEVPMQWHASPRFDFGRAEMSLEWHEHQPVFSAEGVSFLFRHWDSGEVAGGADGVGAEFAIEEGRTAQIALCVFDQEPVFFPSQRESERRLEETDWFWQRRAGDCTYEGPWRDAVLRSSLLLELLVHGPSGALVAAPTMALPEALGGSRNWDYRYAWLRDATFAIDALLAVGYRDQAHASLAWVYKVTERTHPRLQVFYNVAGEAFGESEQLALQGYRASQPVLLGNEAAGQLQLDNWGDLMETSWLYVQDGNALPGEIGQRLAEVADFACEIWRNPSASMWELDEQEDYTEGKMACWVALDRVLRLCEAGQVRGRHPERWRRERTAIEEFIEQQCWSEEGGAYTRHAGGGGLDASVLLFARAGFGDPRRKRFQRTIEAIRSELGRGPFLYRYSGMQDEEGAFLACSFWLVEALARSGRVEEASELMETMVATANDVGLYSEEIDPQSGEFLGNFPQALTHLSLVNAAITIASSQSRNCGSTSVR